MAPGCGCSRSTPITTLPNDAASAAQGEAPPARLGIWGLEVEQGAGQSFQLIVCKAWIWAVVAFD